MSKDRLLDKRDSFIAKRIVDTLDHSEEGILFIGAYHNIKQKLPKNTHIKEVKDIKKVREYHQLLPFYKKNKKRFEELSEYLVSKVEA
ncbi:MAG: hypothetical protein ISS26_08220 [Candidatus Omnitrophica bacterium]|nr:hypothetical protein [Candidatus Omnitrophota bacterium]